MADNMNVTVRDPLAPRRQMPPIVIGRAGEYGATTVTFDLRGLIDRYGAGVPTLLHKRPPDDEAYIVPTSAADTETHDRTEMPDSETLVWHVGQVATSYVGNGKIELQWHPDGAAKKSAQFDVVVLGTIGNPVSEIPDAQQIYLDVMQGIADDAETAAARAEAAADAAEETARGALRYDAAQTLSDAQKEQARLNIDAVSERTYDTLEMDVENVKAAAYAHIRDASAHVSAADRERWNAGGGAVESVNGMTGAVTLTASDVGALPDDTQIPSKTSDLTNDSGFVTAQQAAAVAPVQSVNGKTGTVVLGASDVHALPDSTVIPPTVTEQTVAGWGFTKNTGTYSKPSGGIPASDLAPGVIPTVPQMATQADMSDWTSGKTVDALRLKAYFEGALQSLDAISRNFGQIQSDLLEKADKTEIPTNTSDLTNDSGFQTAAQVQTAIGNATGTLQPKAITDTGGYFSTDTVEGALQEIGAELSGINTLLGTGVIS